MSRSDRIVNLLLVLAWVLLIVRVGRIYFDSTPVNVHAVAGSESFVEEDALPSPLPLPTPTAITGPQQLRPIVGKCHYFMSSDNNKFEFCAFRSVRQILLSNYRSVVTGHWKEWITETGADGKIKYKGQMYDNGEECPGFGTRHTIVEYRCKKDAKGLEAISVGEYDICKYKLVLAMAAWCEVEPNPTTLLRGLL